MAIQMLIDELTSSKGPSSISVILNEVEETEIRVNENDSDEIQIEELRGGCPCCSMEGDLKRVLKKSCVEKSDVVIIEVTGACDLEHLKNILLRMDSSAMVAIYFVSDAASFKPLLEMVPAVKHNITVSDGLLFAHSNKPGEEEMKGIIDVLKEIDPRIATGTPGYVFGYATASDNKCLSSLTFLSGAGKRT